MLARNEVGLDYAWADGSPAPQVNDDNFSARWTDYMNVPAGTYRFTATSDDGVRVWVRDEWIIDEWTQHPATTFTAYKRISGDQTEVVVEYFEAQGRANVELTWERVDAIPPVVGEPTVETAAITPDSGPAGTPVTLTASGFAANETIAIGVGRQYSEYDIVAYAQTNNLGALSEQVTIPPYADPFERWVVVVETLDHARQANSNIFYVTQPDGQVGICGSTYVVQPGDTLTGIAEACDTTLAALISANNWISDPGQLSVGWVLSIPNAFEVSPTVVLAPDSGFAGQGIVMSADGYEPNALVRIALKQAGSLVAPWSQQLYTNADGSTRLEVTIPTYAQPGEQWVVEVQNVQTGTTATSNTFVVTQ